MALNTQTKQQLKIVIVGHVDHGKSTLVGRLLYDTNSLPDGKFEAITASCKKRGMPFEWSFLMDALQIERDQGITVDTTQIWLKTPSRDIVIIDAPGHKEFLKNMISGAAQADAALVLIDAKEGIREQSRRHGYLLHLLGVRQIAVLVNKMDMVGYSQEIFRQIEKDYRAYLSGLGVEPTCFIPISARDGDGIATPICSHTSSGVGSCTGSYTSPNLPSIESKRSSSKQSGTWKNMSWYEGESVTEILEKFEVASSDENMPLRFPIQDIYKFDERRIIAGRIESGTLKVGDELLFSPSNTLAKVASIEVWPETDKKLEKVMAGQSVGITLSDQIFIERGHIASHRENAPMLTNLFRARMFWLGREALTTGKRYKIKLGTSEIMAELKTIEHVIDSNTLEQKPAENVERGNVAEVIWRIKGLVGLDDFNHNQRMGRFVVFDGYDAAGGGIINMDGFFDQRSGVPKSVKSENIFDVDFGITAEQRSLTNGHMGGILWFSGLSGSGKSTIAKMLQKRLFDKGYQVFVLDGDNIRKGLNRDLGFSVQDRAENLRRVAEVAALFAKSGVIVISAFISPTRESRTAARSIAPNYFHNIHIKASLETCEKRDVKGLYAKARAGEIAEFTGISAPYEEPSSPDLVLDTENLSVEACVEQLLKYVDAQLVEPARNMTIAGEGDYAGGI
ncbi:MAG: adenylyl-sulfate kinase [Rickettsiales bacterium]